jgi:hypothetical protein
MHSTKDYVPPTEQDFHRKVAAECFNRTWDYLEQKNRRPDDDQMMLNLAHASRYHWGLIGKPWNFTTGDWQISRVYAALNQPALALCFAKKALEISQRHNLSERLISAYRRHGESPCRGKGISGCQRIRQQGAPPTTD